MWEEMLDAHQESIENCDQTARTNWEDKRRVLNNLLTLAKGCRAAEICQQRCGAWFYEYNRTIQHTWAALAQHMLTGDSRLADQCQSADDHSGNDPNDSAPSPGALNPVILPNRAVT